MIHESKDRGVLTIDLFVGFTAMVLMTYVILHPERLGHIPIELPVKNDPVSITKSQPFLPGFTGEEDIPERVEPHVLLASMDPISTQECCLDEFQPIEDPHDNFANYDIEVPMLKGSFYDPIQTQRYYLLSEEKHADSTVRIRKFLYTWGLTVSAIPEAVDLAWENKVAESGLEKYGEASES